MRKILISLAALTLAALPARAWESHWQARDGIVALVTQIIYPGKTVLYGDSNTEAFWWSIIEGCWVANAGYGGSRIRTLALRAPQIAGVTRPKIVHVMIGTNNLGVPRDNPEWSTLQADIQTIIAAFQAVGSKVVLWPIPPVAPPQNVPAQDRIDINNAILAAAQATGVFYDWWWPTTITGPDGLATAGAMASDGIHLSGQSQVSRYYRFEVWRQHIQTYTGTTCQ